MAKIVLSNKTKKTLLKITLAAAGMMMIGAPTISGFIHPSNTVHASSNSNDDAYDISQWQGYISPAKARQLKREVGFVIIRAQNGGLEQDSQFSHNAQMMQRYHIPYGVYSYSLYDNGAQAKAEAKSLVHRAPNAKFYVNDLEANYAGYDLNNATVKWAREIHRLSSRPAVLYSGLYFMSSNLNQNTRNQYNAIWLADYGAEPNPNYHYDLWQFADNSYSKALGESLDKNTFPAGNDKPLSFWIGNGNGSNNTVRTNSRHNVPANKKRAKRSTIMPLNTSTSKAVKAAQAAAQAKVKKANARVRYYKNQARKQAALANTESQKIMRLQNENKLQNRTIRNDNKTLRNDNSKLTYDQNMINNLKNKLSGNKFHYDNNQSVTVKNKPTANQYRRHSKKVTRIVNSKQVNKKNKKIDPQYYSSKHIDYLIVTNPGGINLYSNSGRKLGHVRKGTILTVEGFKKKAEGDTNITKAIGVHFGKPDIFTSNKNYVHRYTYNF